MPEKEENRVSVKIYESTLDDLKDAQHSARKAGRGEPTYAALIAEAWGAFDKKDGAQLEPRRDAQHDESLLSGLDKKQRRILEGIADMLRAGDRRIKHVEIFVDDWRIEQGGLPPPDVRKNKKAG